MSYSSSDIGNDAVALVLARQLYYKHFCDQPNFHHTTGNALLELWHTIEKFIRQRDVLVPIQSCVKIFDQLTCGIYGTLLDLDEELEASKTSGDPSNLSRISEYREKLQYYELSVGILVDAIER
jgi:hypothetical protein